MLIGIDVSRMEGNRPTGTENYSKGIISHLVPKLSQHQVILYTRSLQFARQTSWPDHVKVKVVRPARLWTLAGLSKEMYQNPPDVLFVPAHVLPLVLPKKTVITIHDVSFLKYPSYYPTLARWYLHVSTKRAVSRATRILAVSQFTKKSLRDYYQAPAERVDVIYPGISGGDINPEAEHNGDRSIFLHLGRIEKKKNIINLLDVYELLYKSLAKETPQLVLAGGMGYKANEILSRIKRSPARGLISIPGYVSESEVRDLLSKSICLLMVGMAEGFGLPVLEAMSRGVPVICVNKGALPEVAGEAAVIVDGENSQEISRAMHRLITDSEYGLALAQRGRRRAGNFSWDRAAERVAEILTN